jgi:hypothetical protein
MEQMESQSWENERKIPLEYKPEVLDESVPDYYKDYTYGQTIRKLKPGIEVEESSSWWLYYSNISLRSSWTWSQAITWVWFKPKMIKIKAYKSSWYVVSEWTWTPLTTNSFSSYESAGNLFITYGTNIIYLLDGSNASYCNISSFDNDWFTLNWTLVQIATNFIYECYG